MTGIISTAPSGADHIGDMENKGMNIIIDGKAHRNVGSTLQEVSRYLRKFITDNDLGASDIGAEFSVLDDDGKLVCYASYNGRMWEKDKTTSISLEGQEEKTTTAAADAKAAGLPSLKAITDYTGTPRSTLNHWHQHKPALFRIVVAGALAMMKEEEQAKDEEPVVAEIPIFWGTDVEHVQMWLGRLNDKGLLWHMEEHPAEIDFKVQFHLSDEAREWLETSRQRALEVCKAEGVDIFTLYPKGILPEPEE